MVASGSPLNEICAKVKHLGYAASRRIRIYGEEFEVISDPFPHEGGVAIHVKTRQESNVRTLRLPTMLLLGAGSRRFVRAA